MERLFYLRRGTAAAAVLLALVLGPQPAQAKDVLVFAAASLRNAVDEAARVFSRGSGVGVAVSYAASSALAKQIDNGAPADLFISADSGWMDWLAGRGAIRTGSRVDLLRNRLALIAPRDSVVALEIGERFPLAAALGDGRLAVAETSSVPAGRYARAALERLGVWADVADRLANAENVRAALALVARGEAPLGIVYATDAAAEPRVRVVDVFPSSGHPPIVYPAALTAHGGPPAADLLDFLRSDCAAAIFARHGFVVPAPSG